jgi:hypothetical protein
MEARLQLPSTVLLAGAGRSGTTWLANVIAASPSFRVVFEPFCAAHVPQAAALPHRPYARADEDHPEWESFVRDALSGRIHNTWVDQEGRRLWAWRVLVKEIRVNLLLKWLARVFKPRVVFIVRHPCAVVLSRLILNWESNPKDLLEQRTLVEDYLHPFVVPIHEAKSALQRHAVMWCIENLVPLKQLPSESWTFCTYERLCQNPLEESQRVLRSLGLRRNWFSDRAIRRTSHVTRIDSALRSAEGDPIRQWKYQLSEEQISEILAIVETFGIDLYGADPMPAVDRPMSQETAELFG